MSSPDDQAPKAVVDWSTLAAVARSSTPGDLADTQRALEKATFLDKLAAERASRAKTDARRARWGLALAAAVVLVVALVFVRRSSAPLTYNVSNGHVERGYLQTAASDPPAIVDFSDGSSIVVGAASRARIGDVSAHGARLVLEEGELEVDVVHRDGARWSIDAGPYSVTVTGTRFSIRWQKGELGVLMAHGSVVVQGPDRQAGVAVHAAQALTLRERDKYFSLIDSVAPAVKPPAPEGSASAAPAANSAEAVVSLPAAATEHKSWSRRVGAGEYEAVLQEAEAAGLETVLARRPLGDLVALADAARYLHRDAVAQRVLIAERTRFPQANEARAAGFLLGRLAEARGDSREAIARYDAYLSEAPHGSFTQEVLGRKLALLWRKRDRSQALPVAEQYLRLFPEGPYAHVARDVTGAP